MLREGEPRPLDAHGNEFGSLAVAIVTYNSADVILGLLDSLTGGLEGVENYDVIVVDNDSIDGSADLAAGHPIQPRVIRMGRNAGYAAGINAAVATISAQTHVLVLNPDLRLSPGTARRLAEYLDDPAVGVAVPKIIGEDGKLSRSLRREPSMLTAWSEALLGGRIAARIGLSEMVDDPDMYRRETKVEWATGAILMISARARRAVGDWDETFFLYSEEVDYFRRMRETGLAAVYVPDACAIHKGGDYHRSPFLSALMAANRIRYYRRHHGPTATLLFRLGIVVGETIRAGLGPAHRAALRAAIAP